MTTKIEWTEETWNPVTGCTKISPGCANCYAEVMCRRFWKQWHREPPPDHFKVKLHPDRLDQPLRWKKPCRMFVCSMSDLFHKDVPEMFLCKVFDVMAKASQHTFQILTKRPHRMYQHCIQHPELSNVWLGVTAENQTCADERIPPLLLQTPAPVRFVSVEPMLGPMDLSHYLNGMPEPYGGGHRGYVSHEMAMDAQEPSMEGMDLGWDEPEWQQTAPPLNWVIIGCESGPNHRPMQLDWARDLVHQCQAAGVAVFVKALDINGKVSHDPAEWPEDLRVREYPTC